MQSFHANLDGNLRFISMGTSKYTRVGLMGSCQTGMFSWDPWNQLWRFHSVFAVKVRWFSVTLECFPVKVQCYFMVSRNQTGLTSIVTISLFSWRNWYWWVWKFGWMKDQWSNVQSLNSLKKMTWFCSLHVTFSEIYTLFKPLSLKFHDLIAAWLSRLI